MCDTMLFAFLFVAVLFTLKLLLPSRKRSGNDLPPSPPSLPFVGHILHLKKPLHRAFRSLSERYGPIFSLRVGSRLIVVVSSPSLVQECFGPNDTVLANRPRFLNSKHVAYDNTTVGTAPYGPHWRNLRRISAVEMLSSHRLHLFQAVRSDEVRRMVAKLASKACEGFVTVNLKKTISVVVMNNIMRMIAGKRYYDDDQSKEEGARRFHEIMQDVLDKSGVGNPADYFPIIKWISPKYVKRVKELGFRMNEFMQGLVDEMRRKREKSDTMLDHLLLLQEKEPEQYTDQIIKGLIQAMMLAGTDTSIVTLTWAMANLLNYPHVLDKARQEIDDRVGQTRLIDESDLPNLPYLQNIISETFRLCPPGPFLLPHYSSADCTVGGYHVPRDTILLVNTWAIHRDPSVWPDPDSFRPERFEGGEEVDAYKLIPFGIGRRACPGGTLGLRIVGLTLGSLVQCFEWKTIGDEPVDMTEGKGLVMHKAEPLVATARARPVATKAIEGAA
ncbi:PREDICTED: isoflavone 2'-hydroxylase-like [Tarenaya hassleriana]|uniref:isoflavone 2'-hydroxylase-like n=1 Tax=Tarenaya hassleriana TaxID=28532 RepID=UPI00053C35D9|nr:PREDICTED: isoflavone 2'-hydroxylase-like [Tarenaya hassleriana]